MHLGASVLRRVAAAAVVLATIASCRRSRQFESNVEVTRIATVRKDDAGNIATLDLEVSYVECPGTQIEVIRGDAAFGRCVAKLAVGDRVRVTIDHDWTAAGHYAWTVRRVGDCVRTPDPNDEASYAMVRECDDWLVNGARVGFQCKYIPEQKLVDKCPWFRRH